jgi:hypothetical protein
VEVQFLPGAKDHAVVDPPRPSAIADAVFDDFYRLVGVPVLGEPVPVGIALLLACVGCRGVGVGAGKRSAVSFELLDQRAEEGHDAAVVEFGGLRQAPGTRRDVDECDHPGTGADGRSVWQRSSRGYQADARRPANCCWTSQQPPRAPVDRARYRRPRSRLTFEVGVRRSFKLQASDTVLHDQLLQRFPSPSSAGNDSATTQFVRSPKVDPPRRP